MVVVCALFAGCADLGAPRNSPPPAEAVTAEQYFKQGNFDLAAQTFLELAKHDRGARDSYRLRAAQAYHENGEIANAAQTLDTVRPARLSDAQRTEYDLLAADIALTHKDPSRALQLLAYDAANLPLRIRTRTLELRARAQAGTGDVLGSARTRAALNRWLGGPDRSQNETQLVATLSQLPPATLKQQAESLLPGDPLRPWLNQALHKSGQALPLVVLHPNRPVGTLMPEQGKDSQREGYLPAHRIGVLLADTGPLRAVAQPIRDGFFSAHFSDSSAQRADIQVYDTGSTAESAVEAYRQAVADGADRIVGPLSRDGVAAVFAQGTLPVPVLALNQPDNGQTPPPGSAAFALTPDAEAAQVAEHMLQRGLERAVVITASEDWAERAALAFRTQFENHNGQVIGEGRIENGEVDFSTMVHQVLAGVAQTKYAPALPGAAATVVSSTPGDIGIFISMRPQQARLLMPQLKLAGYSQVPVFATSHIYSGDYSPGLDRDLDGVEFCDAPWLFDATPGLPNHADITRLLGTARGAGGRLFAMGMDAYALLPYMDWLAAHNDSYLAGATGQLAEDRLGRVQRLLIWARFDNGAAHPINGSLQMSPASQ
ncbi:MAG TPA: penicillin-binding protein activator [Rudaea sp.]|nr:penicillin-binding protein activator [Rudaea sp.]